MNSFEKYVRQMSLADFGEEGQGKLMRASVVLAGAGGVGSDGFLTAGSQTQHQSNS